MLKHDYFKWFFNFLDSCGIVFELAVSPLPFPWYTLRHTTHTHNTCVFKLSLSHTYRISNFPSVAIYNLAMWFTFAVRPVFLCSVQGMAYLHNSDVSVHGKLRSCNCLIDGRFVLKISDFGLRTLTTPSEFVKDQHFYTSMLAVTSFWADSKCPSTPSGSYDFYRMTNLRGQQTLGIGRNTITWKRHIHLIFPSIHRQAELLWVAPELLPVTIVAGMPATQKGDVYSFAIILEEIVVRGGPYESARQFLDVQGKQLDKQHFLQNDSNC